VKNIWLFFFSLFFFQNLLSQNSFLEKGISPIENYLPRQYKSQPQNFHINFGNDGLLYVGNNSGLLQYDGVNFRLIETEYQSRVRSFNIDKKGKIFVAEPMK